MCEEETNESKLILFPLCQHYNECNRQSIIPAGVCKCCISCIHWKRCNAAAAFTYTSILLPSYVIFIITINIISINILLHCLQREFRSNSYCTSSQKWSNQAILRRYNSPIVQYSKNKRFHVYTFKNYAVIILSSQLSN